MKMKKKSLEIWWFDWEMDWQRLARWLLPTPGNVLFTLLVVGGLLWATSAGALPFTAPALSSDSTTTISYQGRLADSSGNPVTTSGIGMCFRLYNTDTGGSPLWEETHAAVPVEDGLFHVLLGSTNPIPVSLLANNSTLWLGITVGADSEMTPREQIASVPYAMIASTVPDGAVTTEKIADEAVTQAKLGADVSLEPADGSITTEKIADGAITSSKLNPTIHYAQSTARLTLNYSSSWTDMSSSDPATHKTVSVSGSARLKIIWTASILPAGDRDVNLRILVDGDEVARTRVAQSAWKNAALVAIVSVGSGDHIIKIQYANEGSTGSWLTDHRQLMIEVVAG